MIQSCNKRRVAVHEAGHTVMYLALGFPIKNVELILIENNRWRGVTEGSVIIMADKERTSKNEIRAAVAGVVAEEIVYGKIDWPKEENELWGATSDFASAIIEARKIVPENEVNGLVADIMKEVRSKLTMGRQYLDSIAAALEAKEKLTYQEVIKICGH